MIRETKMTKKECDNQQIRFEELLKQLSNDQVKVLCEQWEKELGGHYGKD